MRTPAGITGRRQFKGYFFCCRLLLLYCYMSFAFILLISACRNFLYCSLPVPQSPKNSVFTTTKGNKFFAVNGNLPLVKISIVPIRISMGIIPPQSGFFNLVQKIYSRTISVPATTKPNHFFFLLFLFI